MRISLILATLGARNNLVELLLDSLRTGKYRDIELIVVDQSQDESLIRLLAKYRALFPIEHIHSAPGLARGRNTGLRRITGNVVAFPDDDCRYPDALLGSVVDRFRAGPTLGGIAGRPVDAEGRSSFPRWDVRPGPIDKYNVWRRSNSNALFLRREAVAEVGDFDESLGVGSGTPWGSSEEVDYSIRALNAGFILYYDPTLEVHHPAVVRTLTSDGITRAESYAGGMGRVLRKHVYPWWFVLYQLARPLAGTLLSVLTGRPAKALYHIAVFRGRFRGWLS